MTSGSKQAPCKHRAAVASINWMAALLRGKDGADRAATLKTLSIMLDDMVETHCAHCPEMGACGELVQVSHDLSDSRPTASAPLAPPDAFALERLAGRARLSRVMADS